MTNRTARQVNIAFATAALEAAKINANVGLYFTNGGAFTVRPWKQIDNTLGCYCIAPTGGVAA